ncbi:MAG TPA: APC family permease [Acidobacteriaceae bacterium]|nr:APC family permease [Acidobacteriaceae bacterium]
MSQSEDEAGLQRNLGLRGAVALNMLDMIGVGPFITLPLILGAMGGPQAMLGWVLGAGLAVCDGLVWAELGAAMPEAGGTYAFLRRIFAPNAQIAEGTGPALAVSEGETRGGLGRFLGFLFVFQVMFSAPLSVASGCIGLSQYAGYLWSRLAGNGVGRVMHVGGYGVGVSAGLETWVAIAVVVGAVVLLYRGMASLRVVTGVMWCAVMGLIAWILVTGVVHGHLRQAFAFPAGAFSLTPGFFLGLGSAMLIATYDYWGYYNVTFLGGEVKDAARTVPRAILISIGLVAGLYLTMNVSVLAVLPWQGILGAQDLSARRAVISVFMDAAYGGVVAGRFAAVLVMVAAFASVFSLLLGYSRIPYAAARDGNFFRVFGRLHAKGFPHVSLLVLGAGAVGCCFFSLRDVIAALVVLRILVQFLMQHVGVIWLRRTRPEMVRPFRMWLYPMPAVLAICGFGYILVERVNFGRELLGAGVVILAGAVVYAMREWSVRRAMG